MTAAQFYTNPPVSSFFRQPRRSVSLAMLGHGSHCSSVAVLYNQALACQSPLLAGLSVWWPLGTLGLLAWGPSRGCLPSPAVTGRGAGDCRAGGVSVAVCSQFSCPAHSPELYTCLHRSHAKLLVPGPSPWVGLGWGSQRVQAGVFALPLLAKEVAISFPSFWVILCKM